MRGAAADAVAGTTTMLASATAATLPARPRPSLTILLNPWLILASRTE
jgi:hypothetical protein